MVVIHAKLSDFGRSWCTENGTRSTSFSLLPDVQPNQFEKESRRFPTIQLTPKQLRIKGQTPGLGSWKFDFLLS